MSDELKIELQVESDTTKAESQLNDLIDKFKNRKPIDLNVRLGNVDLAAFQSSIKSITTDLNNLASLNFANLDNVASSLKKISNIAKEFKGLNFSNTTEAISKASTTSVLAGLEGFADDNGKFERLSKDHKEALKQVESLRESANFLREGMKSYKNSLEEAQKVFKADNKDMFSFIDELENMFKSAPFKRLIKYKKELNEVEKEYSSLGVDLIQNEKLTNQKYDGTMASRKYQEYVNSIGLDT